MPDVDQRPLNRLVIYLFRFRRQFANLTAFTILQAASYIIPVVTIPYFARTLGIAGMGQLAIAGAVALAAGVLMDYAIQLSGTRFAASHADDPVAINRYLNATTAVKLAILLPLIATLCASTLFLDQVAAHFWVFFWSLLSAAMICLFPQWLFQGLLIMPLAARVLVSCRVAAAVAGLILVHSSHDVFIVPMTQALGGVVALVATTFVLKRRFDIVPGRPSGRQTRELMKENWTLFSATAWGATYTHGGVIIMSTMLTTTSIGFYSIAQKLSQAFISMFNVAAQTGFPSFVRSYSRAAASFSRQVRWYMAAVIVAAASALLVMFLTRHQLYRFFAGQPSDLGVEVFSLWLASSLFTIISVSLNPVMVVLRQDGQMAKVYRAIGLSFLVAAPFVCSYFGILGMAAATLVTEGFMALFFAVSVTGGLRRIGYADAR